MSWDDTGDAIQEAIARSSGVTTIWKDQDVNAPSTDYIAISLGGMFQVGLGIERQVITQDLTRPRGEEIQIETRNDLEASLDLECFTTSAVSSKQAAALSLAMRTTAGLWLPSVKSILQRQAISVFDYSPIQWIPDIPSTRFRGRAITTLRCYMRLPTAVEYVGYIAKIDGMIIAKEGGPNGADRIINFSVDGETTSSFSPPAVLDVYSVSGTGYPLRPAASAVGASSQLRVTIIEADSNQMQTSDGSHWYDPLGNQLT